MQGNLYLEYFIDTPLLKNFKCEMYSDVEGGKEHIKYKQDCLKL